MKKEIIDYSELFDELKITLVNYRMDGNEKVYDKNNKKINDKRIIGDIKFLIQYLIMYEYYRGYSNGTYQVSEIKKEHVAEALEDYSFFNDLMNCVVPEFGTFGMIFRDLSDEFEMLPFFMYNEYRRKTLNNYLELEKDNINRIIHSQTNKASHK